MVLLHGILEDRGACVSSPNIHDFIPEISKKTWVAKVWILLLSESMCNFLRGIPKGSRESLE